jgi:hypothetical protein
MAQLLIRPSLNDHQVIADLLAPPPMPTIRRARPPISQLVADAHIAVQRPTLGESAHEAGIPFLVDPTTVLLQSDVDPKSRWATLPFASARALSVAEIDVDALVEQVVQFQVEHGATQIIAPYLYATEPQDPAFAMSIHLLAATTHYVRDNDVPLPVVAILCAQLRQFATTKSLDIGVGRFVDAAEAHDARMVGLCFSPVGAPGDSYSKLVGLFRAASRATRASTPVVAWRQGIYGPALVAAGLAGYETGIGTGEQTNVTRQQTNRRAKDKKSKRTGGGPGIYLDQLGRSIPKRAAELLLGANEMRPKLMCDDESCCRTVADTLDNGRPHAVRSRARQLSDLADQPHPRWRLHSVARQTQSAATLAKQANRMLRAAGIDKTIGSKNLESLAQVLTDLGQADQTSRSA